MVLSIKKGPKLSKVTRIIWHGPKRSIVVQNFHMDLRSIFLGCPVYHHIHSVILINMHDAVASWILSCSPTWYWQLDIPKCCDTWYCGSSVSGIDNTINTIQHWQHYQQSFHRPCFAILGTAVPDTFYIPPMIEPPRNRINILCRIQTPDQTCELEFIITENAPIILFYRCQCRSVRKAYWIFMKGLSLESFYLQSPGNIFSSSGDFWEVGNNGKAPSAVQRHKYTLNSCLNRLIIDPHHVDHKGVKIDLYHCTMGANRTMVTNPIVGT